MLIQRRIWRHWHEDTTLIHFRGAARRVSRIFIKNWHPTDEYLYYYQYYDCSETRPLKVLKDWLDPFDTIRFVHHDLKSFLLHPEIPLYWEDFANDTTMAPHIFRRHTTKLINNFYIPLLDSITDRLLTEPATEELLYELNTCREIILAVESVKYNERKEK